MTIKTGAIHAAIMAWRDEAILASIALVHDAATDAMTVLEARLASTTSAEAMTKAAAVARGIIRPTMRTVVGATADQWFTVQARALRQVDARFEATALRFAAMGERPRLPQDDPKPSEDWRAPAWLRGSFNVFGEALHRGSDVAVHAVPYIVRRNAERVTARVAREIGERSGAYDRVRAAARTELVRVWLGPWSVDGDVRPYLAQLLDIVDSTARDAKETLA